jgi:two-component system, chemotaxis family, response regulator Rcp1
MTWQILLVEDSEPDVEFTRRAFRDLDVSIEAVSDGQDAIERLEDQSKRLPDIVLLDLNLPRVDGRGVLRAIESDPRLRKMPVVILTSSESETDVNEAYALGGNAYLTKPISVTDFVELATRFNAFWLDLARLPS